MKYLGQIVDDKDLVNKEYVDDASEVVQTLTSGTKIGSVGGTDLYAPTGSGSVLDAYPVGSIYMSVNNTNPGTLFGGTWTQLKDMFLLSAGSTYSVDHATAANPTKDGGSANAIIPYHRHSVDSVSISASGAHTHDAGSNQAFLRYNQGTVSTGVQERSVASGASGNYKAPVVNNANTDWSYLDKTSSETHTHTVPSHNTNYAGTSGNTTGANMPPYLVVYMWKRIA